MIVIGDQTSNFVQEIMATMPNAPRPKGLPETALHVVIMHQIFTEFFVLLLDNNHTEELDPADTREWFKVRGANMDYIEKSMDHAWNFKKAEVYIGNPKDPRVTLPQHAPKI